MEAKELRIGNYAQQFLGVNDDGADYKTIVIDANDICRISGLNHHDIEPIELTEEWLIKIGFTNFGKRWTHSKLSLDIIQGVRFYMNYVTLEITYVHTLQNLFFSLCGEELTIN